MLVFKQLLTSLKACCSIVKSFTLLLFLSVCKIGLKDWHLVKIFPFPDFKTGDSCISEHVVEVDEYDLTNVGNLKFDDLMTKALEEVSSLMDGPLATGGGRKVAIIIIPVGQCYKTYQSILFTFSISVTFINI